MNNDNIIKIKTGFGPEKFLGFLKKLSLIPVIVFLLVLALPNMVYTVAPDEDAVVLRFGKFNRTVKPGLHFNLPFGLETVSKVEVRKIKKMEFGFRTEKAGVQSTYRAGDYGPEKTMLTGDLNVVDVEWIIQYQIDDAQKYLFKVRDVRKNLFDISQAVVREVVGDHTVAETLTEARDEISNQSLEKMQEILDKYEMGIRLVALKLQDVFPPNEVKPSFDAVNAAVQDANQIANQAEKIRKKRLQEERGSAEQVVKNAMAYKINLVNRSLGDAQRFLALYHEYQKAPEITKKRLYFDYMTEAMHKADRFYVVDPEVKGIVPLLSITAQSGGGAQ